MKTIPIITFFLCTVMYAHAQLNIVPKNDGLKEYTVTNAHPYDSLTNVEKRSFTSLPGQTLYMHLRKITVKSIMELNLNLKIRQNLFAIASIIYWKCCLPIKRMIY